MSEITDSDCLDLYEENLDDELVKDYSSQNLESVPPIQNEFICALYLQNNNISVLPEDFFPSLPQLMWLDLRYNKLTEIPTSIQNHPSLTHLLVQNNRITSLPNELGTVANLKVLQVNNNPLSYPPKEVISSGLRETLTFLHKKCVENISQSDVASEDTSSENVSVSDGRQSYNSVMEQIKQRELSQKRGNLMSVQFSEREIDDHKVQKARERCPRLGRSGIAKTAFCQSSRYLKPMYMHGKEVQTEKLKQSYLRDLARKRQMEMLAEREKILQEKKNSEHLNNWRRSYRSNQLLKPNGHYKMEAKQIPYDVNPEYMTLLSREDIERDLPDKYRRKLIRKCRPSVPRRNAEDVHLAMRIKELFDNLEAINLNRTDMSPRTEQTMLLNEIQKISEIKLKLNELSLTNSKSLP